MKTCHYCDAVVADHGCACVRCDRKMRDQTRALSGLAPFTDAEYSRLRLELYGRPARQILVVRGGP